MPLATRKVDTSPQLCIRMRDLVSSLDPPDFSCSWGEDRQRTIDLSVLVRDRIRLDKNPGCEASDKLLAKGQLVRALDAE